MKEYPHILYPQVPITEDDLIDFTNSNKGFTENLFEHKLKKYFKQNILKDVVLNDGKSYPYQPDFVFRYAKHNLLIDIEIDEPYAYKSKEPIHFYDEKRNDYFLQKGWSIIRFAEFQITKYPELCCKVIAEHIKNMTGENIWIEGFHELDNLDTIKAWNLIEASKMASSSYRDTYLKFLQKINEEKASINIIADGIFLNDQIKEAKLIFEKESSIKEFNESGRISIFLRSLIQFLGYFKSKKTLEGKIYVEFTIYISNYHTFYSFSFDTDFIEIGSYIINIYYVRTDKIICFEIFEKIEDEKLNQVILIADDPAYPSFLEKFDKNDVILVKKYRNSSMPNGFRYINIDSPIENSLEIVYK